MKYSLVLTAHNKAHYLEFLLKALRAQLPETEFILLDDGSIDGTGKIMKRYADHFLRTEDIWETLANNEAMKLATGDYIAILQDDDLPIVTNWLEQAVKAMEAFGLDILSGRAFGAWHFASTVPNGQTQEHALSITPDENLGITLKPIQEDPPISRMELVLQPVKNGDKDIFSFGVYEAECIVRSPFILSRKVWDQVGPFDPAFAPLMYDDYDFCLRARAHGFQVGFTNIPKIFRFGGGSQWLYKGGNKEEVFAQASRKNQALLLSRHAAGFKPFKGAPVHRTGAFSMVKDKALIEALYEWFHEHPEEGKRFIKAD